MQRPAGHTAKLQHLLDAARNGDDAARNELLNHACEWLVRLTRRMLREYPLLRRWEQTDDVCQNAMLRLYRALAEVRVESPRHFYNLAALQIRRELLDLAKHYFGPEGDGAKHHTDGQPADDESGPLQQQADPAEEPQKLEDWTRFHAQVEALPDDEREVFSLVFYQGMTQNEAGEVLGLSLRTVKRRWQNARLVLYEALNGERPE